MVRWVVIVGWLMVMWSCHSGQSKTLSKPQSEPIIEIFQHKNTNVYLVSKNGSSVLIDAAYEGSLSKLRAWLRNRSKLVDNLRYMILTHAHVDHAGGAAKLKDELAVQIVAGTRDSSYYVNGLNADICPTSFQATLMSWFVKERYPPVMPDVFVNPKDTIVLEDMDMKIFAMDGHTPGSLIVTLGDKAFVGDLIRGQPLSHQSPARHYFMCDEVDNDRDIEALLNLPHLRTWYPGHFGPLSTDEVKTWLAK